ncbi:hypothetical protein DV515_00001836 [Chloebia gouldiae]|uniref:Immunoglobulin V-set domain-containing protein n=1 Tax=Chloebia gouldiae TaxID=44316 RepID=A0A3L8SYZ2_CHLGU|nr:hypothetical protein DV515_00001836 [Chloebia gouldiae]
MGFGVDMQPVPVQTPELRAQMKGTSARMSCQLEGNHIVHWYRQLPGEPPKRILYGSAGTPVFEDNNDRNRFQVQKDPARFTYNLMINSLTPNGFAQEIPMQSPLSITKFQKSARMTCEIQILDTNFDDIVIHWVLGVEDCKVMSGWAFISQ